ncbi:UBN2 domain-containing protein [Abeliophyllum distichum]|uniref:UBN2 domain-containing protein n=1 Tax=Abeliophyllum distichum TaxID=126358 RepID=A0ABD1RV41_9LAMI
MITHFSDIINGLKGLDRKFTNGELVSKMLRSLSEDWNSLRMLIENTKDVNTYPLDELYGTLMTYEINNAKTKEKARKSKEEMKEPPKRQIALKSTNNERPPNTNMSDE